MKPTRSWHSATSAGSFRSSSYRQTCAVTLSPPTRNGGRVTQSVCLPAVLLDRLSGGNMKSQSLVGTFPKSHLFSRRKKRHRDNLIRICSEEADLAAAPSTIQLGTAPLLVNETTLLVGPGHISLQPLLTRRRPSEKALLIKTLSHSHKNSFGRDVRCQSDFKMPPARWQDGQT